MVLEPEPKRGPGGAERQTSATADKHGSVSRGGGGGERRGRRGEAGNEALGSSAKSSGGQRRHGRIEARTTFSPFICDKTTAKTFYKFQRSNILLLYILNVTFFSTSEKLLPSKISLSLSLSTHLFVLMRPPLKNYSVLINF